METIPSLLFAKRNDADDEVVITCQKCTVNSSFSRNVTMLTLGGNRMPRMYSHLIVFAAKSQISFARSNNEKVITCQDASQPWSYMVRQSRQNFHTRTGAKFHSKSHHGRVLSDNHRKFFTPELVQSFTAKAMVVCGLTITAKVSHQNWCKVSQQKPWSLVVRQSPHKFRTRTGATFHSKSHGRVWSDNHRKSFTPELVQSFTAKAMVVCRQTITAKVSHQN